MKIDICDFVIKECSEKDISSILDVQDEAFRYLESPELLRKNTEEMLLKSLRPPHITLGAWYKNELAAFSVLYFPDDDEENLMKHLIDVDCTELKSANYKLCIVRKDFRGNSLQYELGKRLTQYAVDCGVDILCATVSPHNSHSSNNVERLGFVYNRTFEKYGHTRNLYCKVL